MLEGNLVNLDVTAPGATLALGLMYLRTNDAAVARAFAVPDTHFALDYVKPDLILLRVLARGLVMWDEVAATQDWVESQLPEIMKVGCPSSSMLHSLHLFPCFLSKSRMYDDAAAGRDCVESLLSDILQSAALPAQRLKMWILQAVAIRATSCMEPCRSSQMIRVVWHIAGPGDAPPGQRGGGRQRRPRH